jgi:DMSO/TMAO reductase YedYZ molybdopterin-dependent catalytic subunit
MKITRSIFLLPIILLYLLVIYAFAETKEIRDYQGQRLDPYSRAYDNSIKGPQTVSPDTYRLKITGLVDSPRTLTYQQVLALPVQKRAITLYCVEGWNEHLLFEGILINDLLALAKPRSSIRTIIFYAADGYSSSLKFDEVRRLNLMLAYKINGRVLDAQRGFPFQVVAESKLGYKWVKWVERIDLSDKPFQGFWERQGYDNQADVQK